MAKILMVVSAADSLTMKDGSQHPNGTPWFVETVLREQGAVVELGPDWSSFVVRDGNLISGQNPQSSHEVATAVLSALSE